MHRVHRVVVHLVLLLLLWWGVLRYRGVRRVHAWGGSGGHRVVLVRVRVRLLLLLLLLLLQQLVMMMMRRNRMRRRVLRERE